MADAVDGPALEHQSVVLGAKPDECSLDDAALPDRRADWATILDRVERREPLDDGVRLVYPDAGSVGRLAELVAAEQSCCNFFRFAIVVDQRGIALEVRSDAEHRSIVDELFGER